MKTYLEMQEIKKEFKLNNSDIILISLLFLSLLTIAIYFPELEMPDEYHHYNAIAQNLIRNWYHPFMHYFYGFFGWIWKDLKQPVFDYNSSFLHASNMCVYFHNGFNSLIIIFLKFIHIFFLSIFLGVLYKFLKKASFIDPERKQFIFRLNLLYFSWPPVTFSLLALSNDYFIYLYEALFFVILVFYGNARNFILLFFFNLLLLKFNDNGALPMLMTTFYYGVAYYFFKVNRQDFTIKKKLEIILVSFGIVLVYGLVIKFRVIHALCPSLGENIDYNYQFGYNPLKAFGILFLTMYYLGGSVSFMASYAEYFLFFILVCFLIKKVFSSIGFLENRLFLFLSSFFVVFNIILLTIPVIHQARFYYFLIPPILLGIFYFIFKDPEIKNDRSYLVLGSLFFVSTIVKLFEAVLRSFFQSF